ncbi:MAG: FtsX-like permease family protein [Candidatus Cloacimonadota bacterium]|nr:FtsX-like permease family protein [Candidatus Cloacimonadota bacterium]
MYIFKLAYRNLFGKGIRSWLNFFVLSFAYVAIIWMQGLNDGMMRQAGQAMVLEEIGEGQYWAVNYDPFDPFTLDSAFVKIPQNLPTKDVPILMTRAIAYPKGSMRSIILKGISENQELLLLPTRYLQNDNSIIVGFIGARMAKSSGLHEGDLVTVRWKNSFGAYDATEIKIVNISTFQSPSVDNNQIWLGLQDMQKLMRTKKVATIIVVEDENNVADYEDWEFKEKKYLMRDLIQMVKMKSGGVAIFYIILLFLAVISIFDTQILSLFRRRKEMGTMMALGVTRTKLVLIYTLEGFLNAIMAATIGAIYGIPLLILSAKNGIGMPEATDDFGIAGLSTTLYPVYSAKLILGTVAIIFVLIIIVSYLPSKRISTLDPTDALRGRWTAKRKK